MATKFLRETVYTREKDGKQNMKLFIRTGDLDELEREMNEIARKNKIKPEIYQESFLDDRGENATWIMCEVLIVHATAEKIAPFREKALEVAGEDHETFFAIIKEGGEIVHA